MLFAKMVPSRFDSYSKTEASAVEVTREKGEGAREEEG
jgi:hypothetical protein